jgi:succinate dehydrogenase / fumarate reductase cytochrome b subunit
MTSKNRPLSPHIQIYKPQLSSFTSILHRLTGIFLYVGVVAICWAIVYYTYQVEIVMEDGVEEVACDCIWLKILSAIFYLAILAWVFSLYYHLCNGIRHLFWDIGKGFDKKTANRNGIIVLLAAFLMTAASIYYVLFCL